MALIGGAVLVVFLSKAKTQVKEHEATIETQKGKIDTLTQKNTTLTQEKADLTTNLTQARDTITQTENRLLKLKDDFDVQKAEHDAFLEKTAEELAAKDETIKALNDDLAAAKNKHRDYDTQISDLNTQIVTKDQEIDAIQRRLEASDADREFLLKQRDKLIAEKAELEKQFQDIAVLREKVLKLQGELMASRKLEWIRRGLYGGARQKGGSKLMSMSRRKPKEEPTTNADLNVEIRRDGTVKIAPTSTNTPPDGVTP
ncbi:MAG: hypothetical protein ACPGR8_02610 [Limisphaerales bacterium]